MNIKAFRSISYLLAFLGALLLIDRTPVVLIVPRLVTQSLSPFLAMAGWGGALVALIRGDRKALVANLFASLISLRYIVRVTRDNDSFERAFGPNWRLRVPPELEPRLLPSRWRFIRRDPPDVRWHRDVVICTDPSTDKPLLADIWEPMPDVFRTGLAVVYLHGGFHYYGDKDMMTRPFFQHLAGQGHVIVDLAYTLAPEAHLHGQVADVKRAIAWVKTNAEQYGVNPERVVLMGGSAGGHLALLSAYASDHPAFQVEDVGEDTSVRAVVSYYGVADCALKYYQWQARFSDMWTSKSPIGRFLMRVALALKGDRRRFPSHLQPVTPLEASVAFLGGTPEEVPEEYQLASPVTHVGKHCPPTLLLQGAVDVGIVTGVKHLHRALCQSGVQAAYMEYPDTEHCFDLVFPESSPVAQSATYDTERFLALMV